MRPLKSLCPFACLPVLLALASFPVPASADTWASWRGVNSDGVSADTGLPSSWSPDGENLLWKAPYGGRSAPVVVDGRVCVVRLAEPGTVERWQEQIACLDAETGELVWEHRYNVFQTDIPHHRVGWASLVGDPDTGNVFAHGVEGMVIAFDPEGSIIWSRSTSEEVGRISGYGGRTSTPILDGDLLVVNFLSAGWGSTFIPRHRFYALDKRTGETVWLSTPGNAPYDTTYTVPVVREIDGQRLLISGNGDGAIHAMQVATGLKVWEFPISKRGINSSVVVDGSTVYASHSEENVDESTAMGRLVALDASRITDGKPRQVWAVDGFAAGYASPVIHEGILYGVDNSANLVAFDSSDGTELWKENIGIAQRSSPVVGDGKLYVSDVDGQLHILQLAGREPPEKTDHDEFKDPDGSATQINGSPAIANGRVYFITNNTLYCIASAQGASGALADHVGEADSAPQDAEPAHLQIVPGETILVPGGKAAFRARLFDAKGRLIGETEAAWSLEGPLGGQLNTTGEFTASDLAPQGGHVVATAKGLTGKARVAVRSSGGFLEDFERYDVDSVPDGWSAIRGRFRVVESEGGKMLLKPSGNPRTWRTTVYVGMASQSEYEIEAEMMSMEQRRRLADMGLVSHRYTLALMGNAQSLMVRTWLSELERFSKEVPFEWDPEIWYHVKLRVEPDADGSTSIRGKVWPRGQDEPAEWSIEAVDAIGHDHGAPAIYGYSSADIHYDNVKVTPFGD
ncbi:MAG: PQQ-binding-like beta-propeller repeat protein [Bryobacterales bacterium]|nr:PQQ-binding-like beta-propeller repeat protein [Bryobacterales bacterium]